MSTNFSLCLVAKFKMLVCLQLEAFSPDSSMNTVGSQQERSRCLCSVPIHKLHRETQKYHLHYLKPLFKRRLLFCVWRKHARNSRCCNYEVELTTFCSSKCLIRNCKLFFCYLQLAGELFNFTCVRATGNKQSVWRLIWQLSEAYSCSQTHRCIGASTKTVGLKDKKHPRNE